jgi:hypothetical protein
VSSAIDRYLSGANEALDNIVDDFVVEFSIGTIFCKPRGITLQHSDPTFPAKTAHNISEAH